MATSKLQVAMFPWFAFGHFIPYLHLSNKLAERGFKVSYLLPKGASLKLQQLNHHSELIHFLTLAVPHVDGLPPGAETDSDVPFSLHDLLVSAMDKTRDKVETILSNLKPDIVFFDFARWIPAITRQLGTKSIHFSAVNACAYAFFMVPARRISVETTLEEQIQPPPGYPSATVIIKPNEAPHIAPLNDAPARASLYERLTDSLKESDAIAMRTCREIEGPYCDYLAQQYSKPVLLTGPVLSETQAAQLEEKWDKWLNKFEPGSVVYCAFGSQMRLQKEQFQEMILGFELSGFPFLVALTPPHGCSTIEEALPEGFKERIADRGWVDGGWVPQTLILKHASIGCFVSHCGFGSMWESLVSDCRIVLIPYLPAQAMAAKLMVEELKVAVEVERRVDGMIGKEGLRKAIKSVMDNECELGKSLKNNHFKWKNIFSGKNWQDEMIDIFVRDLQFILESGK
ncbi:anthocyanidin 3-O-glucoside 2'''-O-xylosyltransferase-like [Pistacia vera]|uniref:anthocyanidin 3-O-glucoside 2'''-O-xylosyltransferase-like n=1 Tax=Pistacia vera TaxID=55513 RepID=UPI00126340B8|nr:anthocyanidin 3-O-glucoside 2'''-O-xylosyltransferase-like [Pistacia vera]